MITQLSIIGHPSYIGGADTELDHQIHVWQSLGIDIHIIPFYAPDEHQKSMNLESRGCIYHKPRDWSACKGMPVINYCGDDYLENLYEIKKYASITMFANCMTWLFNKEEEVSKYGLLDYEIYQREEIKDKLLGQLRKTNPDQKGLVITPYFHTEEFPFIGPELRRQDKFYFGRIHRSDPSKFHPDTVRIYDNIVSNRNKEGIILGMDDKCLEKIGTVPDYIKCYKTGGMLQQDFYKSINMLIQPTDPAHNENLPRVVMESMSMGVPVIVDDRGGFKTLVIHGKTGWRCKTAKEFSYYASRMAFEVEEYYNMAYSAREMLENNYGMAASRKSWGNFFSSLG